jgi:hypothetical protein
MRIGIATRKCCETPVNAAVLRAAGRSDPDVKFALDAKRPLKPMKPTGDEQVLLSDVVRHLFKSGQKKSAVGRFAARPHLRDELAQPRLTSRPFRYLMPTRVCWKKFIGG